MSETTVANAGERRASTANLDDAGRSVACEYPAYCMLCGRQLTDYTWDAIEGAAFCSSCVEECGPQCQAVLAILPGHKWFGIVVQAAGILWLSPISGRMRFSGIGDLSRYLADIKQAAVEMAARHLKSEAYITVAISKANQREW